LEEDTLSHERSLATPAGIEAAAQPLNGFFSSAISAVSAVR
jgi:hypothetical protein